MVKLEFCNGDLCSFISPTTKSPLQSFYKLCSFFYINDSYRHKIQTALSTIADWMTSNLLCLNSTKTEFLLLGLPSQLNKIRNPVLTLSTGISVPPAASARNLGFIFDSQLTFSNQVSAVSRACFTISVIFDASSQFLTLAQPMLLAHHL